MPAAVNSRENGIQNGPFPLRSGHIEVGIDVGIVVAAWPSAEAVEVQPGILKGHEQAAWD